MCMNKVLSVAIITAWVNLGIYAAGAQTMDESMPDMNNSSTTSMEDMPGMEPESKQDDDQNTQQDAEPGMDHSSMPGMGHGDMNHGTESDSTSDSKPGMDHSSMMDHNMDHTNATMGGNMAGMSHGSMQGGSAPPDARDPHAYSDGMDFGPIPRPRLGDEHSFGSLLIDRLEAVHTSDNNSAAYSLQGWYGRDYDRAVLKAEGEVDNGKIQEARTQLLWGHAITAYWNTQLGLRYDSGEEPGRGWLAFGVQGLAPYWFEMDATGYMGEQGRFALNLEAEYELLITQKLILQPRLETDLYSKKDSERGIGSGLSEVTAGLRLRYDILRQFGPYVGVEWSGLYGGTADYAREAGTDTNETKAVAGIRAWF
jgi:copper resistance protein B